VLVKQQYPVLDDDEIIYCIENVEIEGAKHKKTMSSHGS
jgi:hypothetical protein